MGDETQRKKNRIKQSKTFYTQITTIESVVPGGLGRSRMVTTDPDGNYKEIDMENFFSFVGINFGNVRKNDKMITELHYKFNPAFEVVANGKITELYPVNNGAKTWVYTSQKEVSPYSTSFMIAQFKKKNFPNPTNTAGNVNIYYNFLSEEPAVDKFYEEKIK